MSPASAQVERGGPVGRWRRTVAVVATLLSVLVVATSTAGWALLHRVEGQVDRVDVFAELEDRPPESTGGTNFLLVGSDTREGISRRALRRLTAGSRRSAAGQRSDTVILAHVSGAGDAMTLISLPRDSLVKIPAHDSIAGGSARERVPERLDKLNVAYAAGGPELTVRTVEHNTGVRIDHYVEVDFAGFVRLVDALGGVDVCLPAAVDDVQSGLDLPEGRSHVGGVQGLAYVRARAFDPTGDIGRIGRQQRFLAALVDQALSRTTLLNPVRLQAVVDAALSAVRTDDDLDYGGALELATRLRGASRGDMIFTTVPLADSNHVDPDLGSTVLWDEAAAAEMFAKVRADQPIREKSAKPKRVARGDGEDAEGATVPPASIRVRALNAGGTPGLAAQATADLRAAGFTIAIDPADAGGDPATETVVRFDPRWSTSARTVRAALPAARFVEVPGLGETFEVLAGSSYDGVTDVSLAAEPSPTGRPDQPAGRVRTAADSVCD